MSEGCKSGVSVSVSVIEHDWIAIERMERGDLHIADIVQVDNDDRVGTH